MGTTGPGPRTDEGAKPAISGFSPTGVILKSCSAKSRLRNAKLRHGQASIEDVDYRAARRIVVPAFPETN
jgi:hypothetical protein